MKRAFSKIEEFFATPEWAKSVLAHPENKNRSPRQLWVEKLANTCKAGGFVEHHQAVALGPTGRLYDGQHRMMAIVLSGIGQWIVLATYASDAQALQAMLAIDKHARRAVGEQAEILGLLHDRGKDRMAVASVVAQMTTGSKIARMSDGELVDIAIELASDDTAIRAAFSGMKLSAPSLAAFVWARQIAPERVDAMARKLREAVGMNTTESVLFKTMTANVGRGGGCTERLQHSLKVLRGIEAVLFDEKITRLQEQDRERLITRMAERRECAVAKAKAA